MMAAFQGRLAACVLLAGAVMIPAGSASAERKPVKITQPFSFDARGVTATEPQIVGKGRPLLGAQVRGASAVSIDAPIEVTVLDGAMVPWRRTIAAGEILLGVPSRPGVYCAAVQEGRLFEIAACLTDADKDGKFESSLTAAFTDREVHSYNIGHNGGLVGVTYGDPTSLTVSPIPYRPADPLAGPPARVNLKWTFVETPRPGEAVVVAVYLEVDSPSRASAGLGAYETFTLPGGVGDINYHGLVIHVLGATSDGSIRFATEAGPSPQPIDLTFMFIAPPKRIYMHR